MKLKNDFLESILTYSLFLCFSIFIIKSFGITMPDDGWRHLSMAINQEEIKTWGRLYDHSLYSDYDPWFMWHNLLRFIHNFVDISNIHLVVNSIIYSLLSLWYYLAFLKFTKINKIFILILAFCLPMLNIRYFFLRPDVLSGLFILYFLIIKNKFLLLFISFLYAPFYYIFWFFITYFGYVCLFLKEYKKFIILTLAMIFGFIFYLSYDYEGYLQIMQHVLNNDALTQNQTVKESKTFIVPMEIKNLLGSSNLLILLVLFSLLIYYVFKPKNILFKYIILILPLCLVQLRFLILLEPLIFIFIINTIYKSYKTIEGNDISYFVNKIKIFILQRTYFSSIPKKAYNILFSILIIIFFIFEFNQKKESYKNIENMLIELSFLKENEYKNKKILFTTMSTTTYMATFLNPSGTYIPSCSLGWVTYPDKTKKTYFDLLTNNKSIDMQGFYAFLKFNQPDYLIINTSKTSNLKFSHEDMKKNGLIFYKIINSKLVFRKIY